MKSSYILASVIVLGWGAAGCEKPQPKPEPKPTPQVAVIAVSATRAVPGGIAWFQDSFEEGFSRAAVQAGQPGPSAGDHAGCLQPLTGDDRCDTGAWSLSVRMLSRLVHFVRLGL